MGRWLSKMEQSFKIFKFRYAYGLASQAHNEIFDYPEIVDLCDLFEIDSLEFCNAIIKPQKETLLHMYLNYLWDFENSYIREKGSPPEVIELFRTILSTYEVGFPLACDYTESNINSPIIAKIKKRLSRYSKKKMGF